MTSVQNGKTAATWAEVFRTDIPKWLTRYRGLYAKYGFDLDDAVQEGSMALLKQDAYLDKQSTYGIPQPALARTIVVRACHRAFIGRVERKVVEAATVADLEAAESREHSAHVSLEMAELIETCGLPDVKMYLKALMSGEIALVTMSPELNALTARAGSYVLGWMTQHKWSHES